MIIISCSLDSSLAQAKLQGNLKAIKERYQLFTIFDRLVLLTQDTQGFSDELAEIVHVPCAYSRFGIARSIFSHFGFLRWLYFSFSSFLWLLRNCKEVDLMISENVDSPTPLLFSSLFRVPYFINYRYDVATQIRKINKRPFEGVLLLFLEKLCFKRATLVWSTAANLSEKAKAFGAKKVALIPNWIDFKEKPKNTYEESAESKILFVGRLHPVKRVHLLLEAFGKLRKVNPHASLGIIGDGEERQHLIALAKKLELNSHVQFLGFQSHKNVLDMIRQSDVLVLPSEMEGNPRVLIEAMMLKVPIVATNVPGIRDIVKHSETGHLVAVATAENLAQSIDYVLRNKEYAAKIAENAYEFARQQFSKEHVLERIREDLYSNVPKYRITEGKRPLSSISVIICAYNAEKTIEKCLNSVIQAFPQEKEIIVVEDGSTDHTYEIASKFPVKVLHLDKNKGVPTAKNLGIAKATGDIVAFVDSDCVIEKNYFIELASALNRSVNIGGVGGVIYPQGNSLIADSFYIRFFGYSPSNETKIREIDCPSGAASAYPKELLSRIGEFDASFGGGEDLDMSIRIRKARYKLLVVPLAKAYHFHPTSLRHLVKKWFLYGRLRAGVSLKNNLKKDIVLSWGWVSSVLGLSAVALYTGQLSIWLLFILAFCLPWLLYYGKQTVKFWMHNWKIKYLALPFVHQAIIISRSMGVIVASLRHLFKA